MRDGWVELRWYGESRHGVERLQANLIFVRILPCLPSTHVL